MSNTNTFFTGITEPYIDPVFSINNRYQDCSEPKKVNLGVGEYRNDNGAPHVLKVVRKVELLLAHDDSQTKEYLPITGLDTFIKGTLGLIFGDTCEDTKSGRIDGVQSLSGCGACRLAFELVHKYHDVNTFYVPEPTWPLHISILQLIGVTDIRRYPYYDKTKSTLDWDALLSTLQNAPIRSAVVIHGYGHNPTGVDMTEDQWKIMTDILIDRNLVPILDIAYLGLVSGSIYTDAYPLRYLHSRCKEMLFCISFAKNMCLYNERVGLLGWFTVSPEVSIRLKDRISYIIRNTYSNPPAHGVKVASKIISDSLLRTEWALELRSMCDRIKIMRQQLQYQLQHLKTPGDWSFITKQTGLYSYTNLKESHVKFLEYNYHIFMLKNGRINVSALTQYNVNYVAEAINDAILQIPN